MNKFILYGSILGLILSLIAMVYTIINGDFSSIPLRLGTISLNCWCILIALSDEEEARLIKSVEKFRTNRKNG